MDPTIMRVDEETPEEMVVVDLEGSRLVSFVCSNAMSCTHGALNRDCGISAVEVCVHVLFGALNAHTGCASSGASSQYPKAGRVSRGARARHL